MAKKNKTDEEKMIPLFQAIKSKEPINDQQVISDVFLNIHASQRGFESAYFHAKLCNMDGKEVIPFKVAHEYKGKKQSKIKDLNEVSLYGDGLIEFMKLIQNKELGHFSSVKMYAQERSIEYSGDVQNKYRYSYRGYTGPPTGVTPITGKHYYLELILGTPGKKVRLARTSKIKACEACDAMLLRYTFNWIVQCDDLNEKICPYCKKPLKIIERDRKYVEVELDFNAKDCKISGTNNQIGILYHGRPIKTTVKVAALRNFLMNFQNLFSNSVIGPLDIKINIVKSRKGFNFVESIEPSSLMGKIEWRPVVLFPEDLIAF